MEAYRHQVGGHSRLMKPQDSSKVYKPFSESEFRFYEKLASLGSTSTDSGPLHVLKQFVPKYFGVTEVQVQTTTVPPILFSSGGQRHGTTSVTPALSHQPCSIPSVRLPENSSLNRNHNEEHFAAGDKRLKEMSMENGCNELPVIDTGQSLSQSTAQGLSQSTAQGLSQPSQSTSSCRTFLKYIVLEDLVYQYKKPCVMDLKMGKRQRKIGASPEKEQRQLEKSLKTTSHAVGFRLCGMQFYDKKNDILCYCDKYWGRKLTKDKLRQALGQWFYNGYIAYHELLLPLISNLKTLHSCISELRYYRFWSSSLLWVFDGGSPDTNARLRSLDVRLIDFANTIILKDQPAPDNEYLFGLGNLISILETLVFHPTVPISSQPVSSRNHWLSFSTSHPSPFCRMHDRNLPFENQQAEMKTDTKRDVNECSELTSNGDVNRHLVSHTNRHSRDSSRSKLQYRQSLQDQFDSGNGVKSFRSPNLPISDLLNHDDSQSIEYNHNSSVHSSVPDYKFHNQNQNHSSVSRKSKSTRKNQIQSANHRRRLPSSLGRLPSSLGRLPSSLGRLPSSLGRLTSSLGRVQSGSSTLNSNNHFSGIPFRCSPPDIMVASKSVQSCGNYETLPSKDKINFHCFASLHANSSSNSQPHRHLLKWFHISRGHSSFPQYRTYTGQSFQHCTKRRSLVKAPDHPLKHPLKNLSVSLYSETDRKIEHRRHYKPKLHDHKSSPTEEYDAGCHGEHLSSPDISWNGNSDSGYDQNDDRIIRRTIPAIVSVHSNLIPNSNDPVHSSLFQSSDQNSYQEHHSSAYQPSKTKRQTRQRRRRPLGSVQSTHSRNHTVIEDVKVTRSSFQRKSVSAPSLLRVAESCINPKPRITNDSLLNSNTLDHRFFSGSPDLKSNSNKIALANVIEKPLPSISNESTEVNCHKLDKIKARHGTVALGAFTLPVNVTSLHLGRFDGSESYSSSSEDLVNQGDVDDSDTHCCSGLSDSLTR